MRAAIAAAVCLLALTACQRERREPRPSPTRVIVFGDAARQTILQPGGRQTEPVVVNPYEGNAAAIAEGQRLYNWFNCSGCHFHGGGGIGPPLIKKEWIYGGEPANLFDTIVKGRPNGMPSFGGKIPEYQVWQIVTYVRSLAGYEPQAATARRVDSIERNPNTIRERR
jgi:cytochrome c oxidase cbb3-type subunit III